MTGRLGLPAGRRPGAAAMAGAGIALLIAAAVALSLLARRPGYLLQPIMIAVPAAIVGAVVAARQPRNPNGWLLVSIAAGLLLSTGAGAYSLLVYTLGEDLPLRTLGLILYQLWSPALALVLLIVLLFPDGHPPSPRWRWAAWAYGLLDAGYLALLIGVAADAISGNRIRVDAAYGGLTVIDYPAGRFAMAQDAILAALLALGLSFAIRQLITWRCSSGQRRQQLKWLMSGAAVCAISAGLSLPGAAARSGLWAQLSDVAAVGYVALPVSIGVGILRYRLYDIERLITRTLAYAIVTGLLLGGYAALAAIAHVVLSLRSPLAVAVATLAAVAVFNPLYRRVQRVVDKRFNRARYDAETVIAAFAARMADAAELDEIRADLLATTYRVLQPAHLSIWIRGTGPGPSRSAVTPRNTDSVR